MKRNAEHIQKLIHEANKILKKQNYDQAFKNAFLGTLKSVRNSEHLTAKDRSSIDNLFCR